MQVWKNRVWNNTKDNDIVYVTSLRRLQALAPNFQPFRVMIDYEDSFIIALKEVYGQNLHIEGLCRQFSQPAVVRKAKKTGLPGAFRDVEHIRKCIRFLTCLLISELRITIGFKLRCCYL